MLGGETGAAGGLGVVEPTWLLDSAAPPNPGVPGLRCLIVTSRLDVGGVEEVVGFLARRLPARGVQVAVLHAPFGPSAGAQPSGRIARMLQSSGVEVHKAGESDATDWIQRWHPDVISAHDVLPGWVLAAAQSMAIPYVETLHGMQGLCVADWAAEAARAAKLSAIVAVSGVVRRQYLDCNRRFPPDRIVTIPNGVDDERRSGRDRAAARDRLGLTDEYLFVSLARHSREKNGYGLVAAFGELARRRPEAHLVIAGQLQDIRYYRKVLQLRDSLPCRGRVHLRDHAASPAELLAAADGFVLDSFHRGRAPGVHGGVVHGCAGGAQ